MKRKSKYGATRTMVDNVWFDSKREADRYLVLKILERSGQINTLKLQPRFDLIINGKSVKIRSKGYPNGRKSSYFADFSYLEDSTLIVEDSKGIDTPLSRLKRALVEAIYEVEVRLV